MATLLRIPWSHYCQKAEWGLSLQGIPYDALDIGIRRMAAWTPHLPEGTVPILREDLVQGMSSGGPAYAHVLVPGSSRILQWADRHPAAARPGSLYPGAADVRAWESWADDVIGPLARREAYRCIHATPTRYGRRRAMHAAFFASRPLVLKVLKTYKARRFEAQDEEAVPAILEQIQDGLERTGTGYLVGDGPTAADVAVAALWAPMLPIRDHPARGDAWDEAAAFVRRVRPQETTRRSRRWARSTDLKNWKGAKETVALRS